MSQICNFLSAYVREETDTESTVGVGTVDAQDDVQLERVRP